ncbi:hypothetical protein GLOIN_2v1484840 [Rhizophagus irregularis DAOM 181602=DAOM 197198]|nr:hypothetical protein GLOIN_2v1484840 [Rhizophagus irregularis DAOM 181602=DAOM 197198]
MPLQKKRRQNRVVSKRVANKKTVKRHRNSYSIEQKKQVVAYAKENGIIKASKYFELDKKAEKELYDWIIEQKKQGLGVTYAIA